MVRAMDLAMAVGAAPVKEGIRRPSPRNGRVECWLMALRADPGVRNFQETVVDRTVGLMTVGAILDDRRMLPEKGSAPFGVAHVASFIDACLLELGGVRSPVRVVAVGTGQLPFL